MTTIKEVAEKAGVSVATVSRVINGTGPVKEETRKAVEAAIETLQYNPNLLGRSLRRQETRRILVLLSTISNTFYSRVVRGIEAKAQEEGYEVTLCTAETPEAMLRHLEMLPNKIVDGAILTYFDSENEALREMVQQYPIVCACDPPLEDNIVSSVSIDNRQAASDAIEYLLRRGIRKIALFADNKNSPSSILREQGFREMLQQRGIPIKEDWIIKEGFSYRAGARAAKRLMELGRLPEAVFAIADSIAIGAMHEWSKHRIRAPYEISVIGFDNTAVSEMYLPALTTVGQPQYDIGQQAMSLLLGKINGSTEIERVILPHELIERNSVK